MKITEVQDKRDIKSFHTLPFDIYKSDKNWIPHLRQDIEKVFDPKQNKHLRRDGKIKRWLLSDSSGKTIGRIAAFVNPKYSKNMEQPTGGLGFFECINDQKAAFLLLDTAVNWLKEEGMEAVDGPINFGEKDRFWGLLIENFTDLSSYAMNYNPEYYRGFFEQYGFQIYYNQYVFSRDMHEPAQEVFARKSNIVKNDPAYRVSNIRGMDFDQIAEYFRTVYNNAWGGHHGFKLMTEMEAKKAMQALKPVVDRDIIMFAFHHDKPIGFYVNIPELNEIFRYVNGNLNWLGKLIFLYHKLMRTPKIMVGLVFGVDRAYHGQGIESAMIKWAEEHVATLNRYHKTVLTWIGDFNPKMMKVAENLGATPYRRLATYRKIFDPNLPFNRAPIVN